MPYEKLTDLPDSVRDNLPKHAQEIYRAAYNSARSSTTRRIAATGWAGAPSSKSTRRTKKASGSRRRIETLLPMSCAREHATGRCDPRAGITHFESPKT